MQNNSLTDKVLHERVVKPQPNTFYNLDCMEHLTKCPDNYFDLAIVDPPYGINRDGQTETFTKLAKHKRKAFEYKDWDASPPNQEYFNELMRVSENQIIWGGNYYANNLPNSSCWLIWDKGQRDFTLADAELAWTSFKKSVRIYEISRAKAKAENGKDKIHPTQKPVSLYTKLLRKWAKAGDLILDTHVGSASSLIACKELGFDYVGYEIDKEYYEQAKRRLERAFRKYELDL